MSDFIGHECGIALVRLLKPLQYYINKYGSSLYGLNKMYLLMEKQHNRGQDGAGIGVINFDQHPGERYIWRKRSIDKFPIADIFKYVFDQYNRAVADPGAKVKDAGWIKEHIPFSGELLLGHLRYATHSKGGERFCHPRVRHSNWKTRSLVVAGNFNMTNNDALMQRLIELGQHPQDRTDTITVLEKIGHFLDRENERLIEAYKSEGLDGREITARIAEQLAIDEVLKKSAKDFDGGYAMAGLIGHGDAFVLRDPNGIRPAYWFQDDEVAVVSSERPPLQTAFEVQLDDIKEITPGHALIIRKNGRISEQPILPPKARKSCSFERIYFSRGTDRDIYQERKMLGRLLASRVLEAIDFDYDHTVFSYIPNTAEVAFMGMVEAINESLDRHKANQLAQLGGEASPEALERVLAQKIRAEKIAVKDAKLRTFIADDASRSNLVAHVYDTTYGLVRDGVDNLVVVDDSIVRGTTLRQSILNILHRLRPKRILIVSSAPQIRYPDCYGIDMSKLRDFVAFRAAVELLREQQRTYILEEVYRQCIARQHDDHEHIPNFVQQIYAPFSDEEISQKIAEILRPEKMQCDLQVIYQTVNSLHEACPAHRGDWYFTGQFPTPGGNKVANQSFINFYEGSYDRAY